MTNKCSKQLDIGDAVNDPLIGPRFHCNICHKPRSDTPYSFGGAFACGSCVRAYYRKAYPEMSAADITEELRCRGYEALQLTRKLNKRRSSNHANSKAALNG